MNHESVRTNRAFGLTNVNSTCMAALTIALLMGMTTPAARAFDWVTPPPTPASITPPAEDVAYLVGHASGTQGYVCLPSGTGASWTVVSSRPQATLFTTLFGNFSLQILTHFLSPDAHPNKSAPTPLPFGSPTWQSSFDSSVIWGNKLASLTPGLDPSCPNSGAIPCLLLQVIGSQNGPSNQFGILTNATYVQRLNTNGGSAPATGCAASSDVGGQVLVPYTADYYFYTARH